MTEPNRSVRYVRVAQLTKATRRDYEWIRTGEFPAPLERAAEYFARNPTGHAALVKADAAVGWVMQVSPGGFDSADRPFASIEISRITAGLPLSPEEQFALAYVVTTRTDSAGNGRETETPLEHFAAEPTEPDAESATRAWLGLPLAMKATDALYLMRYSAWKYAGVCYSGHKIVQSSPDRDLGSFLYVNAPAPDLTASDQEALRLATDCSLSIDERRALDDASPAEIVRALRWASGDRSDSWSDLPPDHPLLLWVVTHERSFGRTGPEAIQQMVAAFGPRVATERVFQLASPGLSPAAAAMVGELIAGRTVADDAGLRELLDAGHLAALGPKAIPLWIEAAPDDDRLRDAAIRILGEHFRIEPATARFVLDSPASDEHERLYPFELREAMTQAAVAGLPPPRRRLLAHVEKLSSAAELDVLHDAAAAWPRALWLSTFDDLVRTGEYDGKLPASEVLSALRARLRARESEAPLYQLIGRLLRANRPSEAGALLDAAAEMPDLAMNATAVAVTRARVSGSAAPVTDVDALPVLIRFGIALPEHVIPRANIDELYGLSGMWAQTSALASLLDERPVTHLPKVPPTWCAALRQLITPEFALRVQTSIEPDQRDAFHQWIGQLHELPTDAIAQPSVADALRLLPWLRLLTDSLPLEKRVDLLCRLAATRVSAHDETRAKAIVDTCLPNVTEPAAELFVTLLSEVGSVPLLDDIAPWMLAKAALVVRNPGDFVDALFRMRDVRVTSDSAFLDALVAGLRARGAAMPRDSIAKRRKERHPGLALALSRIQDWSGLVANESERLALTERLLSMHGVDIDELVKARTRRTSGGSDDVVS